MHHIEKKDNLHSEIIELRTILDGYLQQNQRIYTWIVDHDSLFFHHLYKPKFQSGGTHFFMKELLLKQIDKLMDEKDQLIRKRERLEFKQVDIQNKKEAQFDRNANHYSVLRSAWTRFSGKQIINTSQKIDNMNKVVGMIKNNIKGLILSQNTSISNDLANEIINASSKQKIIQERNRQKLQMLVMRNQELNSKYCQLLEKLHAKDEKIKRLQEQLNKAGGQIKKSLQALCTSREKIMNLEQNKRMIEEKINKVQNQYRTSIPNLIYEGQNERLKIKIESSSLTERKNLRTHKNLQEILNFLGDQQEIRVSEFKDNPQSNKVNDIMLPLLDLGLSETKLRPKGQTQRLNNSHAHKFIPMRTQRVNNNKSVRLQTTICSSTVDDSSPPQLSSKKFIRKGDLPLTTGRKNITKIGTTTPNIQIMKTDSL